MWQKSPSTNDNFQQFTVHIPGVHQDRNDAQVQAGHHWLPPRPFPVIRQPPHQPITSQHTNDVTHSYNPRSEYFTLLGHIQWHLPYIFWQVYRKLYFTMLGNGKRREMTIYYYLYRIIFNNILISLYDIIYYMYSTFIQAFLLLLLYTEKAIFIYWFVNSIK